jgi:formamidopyrimidine-DNA glycosylase
MPELPEVEITARRLSTALGDARVESALAPGMVALKTIDPPLSVLEGLPLEGVVRIGKMLVVRFGEPSETPPERTRSGASGGQLVRTRSGASGGQLVRTRSGASGELVLLFHLMSAGRLQLFDKRASLRDRASRILVRLEDGRELRLREFGSRQRAWAKLLREGAVKEDEMVATLGPEAWPPPPLEELAAAIDQPRHLHPMLRDQRVVAGIGRSWVDEILWEARLSPFRQGSDLEPADVERLHEGLAVLGQAIEHYEEVIPETVPDKMPMPLRVHRREGSPCPRCGTTIEAVFFKEHQANYCPTCQTGGKVLKDRRLSRLLK